MVFKKLVSFLFTTVCCINIFAYSKSDQIIVAMLLNQINFSVETITHYKDKAVLDKEFDYIINNIDKSRLIDDKLIEQYTDLLTTITTLKLSENERFFLTESAEIEKRNAIYNSLSSFGSVFIPGRTPIQLITSLAYTGVSAAFNYKKTIANIDKNLREELFALQQSDIKALDEKKTGLFGTYARLIQKYEIPKRYEISQQQIKWFVEIIDEKNSDPISKANLLKDKEDIFSIFPPYWYELGCAYQEIKDFKNAKRCYSEFEKLKQQYSIIDNDAYYTELAKNRIAIAIKEKKESDIQKYLQIIENDENIATKDENRLYLANIYSYLGNSQKANKNLELIIDENKNYVESARLLKSITSPNYEQLTLIDFHNNLISPDSKEGVVVFSYPGYKVKAIKLWGEQGELYSIRNGDNFLTAYRGILKNLSTKNIENSHELPFLIETEKGTVYVKYKITCVSGKEAKNVKEAMDILKIEIPTLSFFDLTYFSQRLETELEKKNIELNEESRADIEKFYLDSKKKFLELCNNHTNTLFPYVGIFEDDFIFQYGISEYIDDENVYWLDRYSTIQKTPLPPVGKFHILSDSEAESFLYDHHTQLARQKLQNLKKELADAEKQLKPEKRFLGLFSNKSEAEKLNEEIDRIEKALKDGEPLKALNDSSILGKVSQIIKNSLYLNENDKRNYSACTIITGDNYSEGKVHFYENKSDTYAEEITTSSGKTYYIFFDGKEELLKHGIDMIIDNKARYDALYYTKY